MPTFAKFRTNSYGKEEWVNVDRIVKIEENSKDRAAYLLDTGKAWYHTDETIDVFLSRIREAK